MKLGFKHVSLWWYYLQDVISDTTKVRFEVHKSTFINTPDSFSTPIGGERVMRGCF